MKTWKTIDKSEWPTRGQWDNEPDKAQWINRESNLDCLIVRGPSGALCGYVGVPDTHSLYEVDYSALYDRGIDIEAHGGLTYSDRCAETEDESRGICHTGEVVNKVVWWFGFDCAHLNDLTPKYHGKYPELSIDPFDVYRDFNYVKNEVDFLAKQLSAAA